MRIVLLSVGLLSAATLAAREPPPQAIASVLAPSDNATVHGSAVTSVNGALPDATMRLRDARAGHIVDMQVTDRAGLFAFHPVEPGTYVVEIVASDQTILAASQMLTLGPGDAVSVVVKLPFRLRPFGFLLGRSGAAIAAVAAAAAASGVLGAAVTGQPISPPQ